MSSHENEEGQHNKADDRMERRPALEGSNLPMEHRTLTFRMQKEPKRTNIKKPSNLILRQTKELYGYFLK